jgi:hypothetical protein
MLAQKVLLPQLGVFALARVNVDNHPLSVNGNNAEGGSFEESGQSLRKWRGHLFFLYLIRTGLQIWHVFPAQNSWGTKFVYANPLHSTRLLVTGDLAAHSLRR